MGGSPRGRRSRRLFPGGLFRAHRQARRRLDAHNPAGFAARGRMRRRLQQSQRHATARGRACAADVGRGRDGLPRIRTRSAQLAFRRRMAFRRRRKRSARLRRVSFAGQRNMGQASGGAGELRSAFCHGRAHAGGFGGLAVRRRRLRRGVPNVRNAAGRVFGPSLARPHARRPSRKPRRRRRVRKGDPREARYREPLDTSPVPKLLLQPRLLGRLFRRLLLLPVE